MPASALTLTQIAAPAGTHLRSRRPMGTLGQLPCYILSCPPSPSQLPGLVTDLLAAPAQYLPGLVMPAAQPGCPHHPPLHHHPRHHLPLAHHLHTQVMVQPLGSACNSRVMGRSARSEPPPCQLRIGQGNQVPPRRHRATSSWPTLQLLRFRAPPSWCTHLSRSRAPYQEPACMPCPCP